MTTSYSSPSALDCCHDQAAARFGLEECLIGTIHQIQPHRAFNLPRAFFDKAAILLTDAEANGAIVVHAELQAGTGRSAQSRQLVRLEPETLAANGVQSAAAVYVELATWPVA